MIFFFSLFNSFGQMCYTFNIQFKIIYEFHNISLCVLAHVIAISVLSSLSPTFIDTYTDSLCLLG